MAKKSQNNNIRMVVNGIKFDSKKEATHYILYKGMEKEGHITNLVCHPKFILQEKFRSNGVHHRAITYSADFSFHDVETDTDMLIDIKPWDKKTEKFLLKEVFRIKRKLLAKAFPDLPNITLV